MRDYLLVDLHGRAAMERLIVFSLSLSLSFFRPFAPLFSPQLTLHSAVPFLRISDTVLVATGDGRWERRLTLANCYDASNGSGNSVTRWKQTKNVIQATELLVSGRPDHGRNGAKTTDLWILLCSWWGWRHHLALSIARRSALVSNRCSLQIKQWKLNTTTLKMYRKLGKLFSLGKKLSLLYMTQYCDDHWWAGGTQNVAVYALYNMSHYVSSVSSILGVTKLKFRCS